MEADRSRFHALLVSTVLGKVFLSLIVLERLPLFNLVPNDPSDVAIHAGFLVVALVLIYYDHGPLFSLFAFSIPAFDLFLWGYAPTGDVRYAMALVDLLLLTLSQALLYMIPQQIVAVPYRRYLRERFSLPSA